MAKPENEFYDLEKLADWAVRLLLLGLFLTVVSSVSTWFELQLLNDIRDGNYASEEAMLAAAEANDRRQLTIAIIEGAAFLGAGVLSLIWIYRSAHNARVHATRVEYTAGSCVWWFFIPVAWLWKPYSAMKETWSESATQSGAKVDDHSVLLGTWWACWIISGLCYHASLRMAWGDVGLNALITSDKVLLVGSAVDTVATVLFINMVRRLTKMQGHLPELPPRVAPSTPGAGW